MLDMISQGRSCIRAGAEALSRRFVFATACSQIHFNTKGNGEQAAFRIHGQMDLDPAFLTLATSRNRTRGEKERGDMALKHR
jgi:hypothetical protein